MVDQPGNLIHQTTTSTGTGNISLSTVFGKRAFIDEYTTGGTDKFWYYIRSRDAAQWEVGTGHLSASSTLVRDTVIQSSNSDALVSFSAGTKDVTNDIPAGLQIFGPGSNKIDAVNLPTAIPPHGFTEPINLALNASVAANALTVAIKGVDGNDASATNPVLLPFRSATEATGTPTWRSLTAALSLTVSSGSTLGTSNSVAFRFWLIIFDDAGTLRLGVINCRDGTDVRRLSDDELVSSSAEGGAGGADAAHTFYTGTAVTSKAYRVVGYLEYSSGLATAGTYASGPTKLQIFGPAVHLPGALVQQQGNIDSALSTGTTTVPLDNTIPQNTEGNEYLTQAITPAFEGNVLRIQSYMLLNNNNVGTMIASLFQDSTADALAASAEHVSTAGTFVKNSVRHFMVAGTTSSTTFKMRAGSSNAGTTSFNGAAASARFGGVANSYLEVEEIMA